MDFDTNYPPDDAALMELGNAVRTAQVNLSQARAIRAQADANEAILRNNNSEATKNALARMERALGRPTRDSE